jgi:tetratricopeptide (TPR) repeat protein
LQRLESASGFIGAAMYYLGRGRRRKLISTRRSACLPAISAFRWIQFVGFAKLQLGVDAEAMAWLRRSIEANRNNPMTHFALAAALALLGARDEARSSAQAGLALDPGFTLRRYRANTPSDNPTFLVGRERIYQAMRLAGPEG